MKKWTEARKATWRGENNPNWKGMTGVAQTGRSRAERYHRIKPICERCKKKKRCERHHKDGNTFNNQPENIANFCRRCHMIVDGRMAKVIKNNPILRAALFASYIAQRPKKTYLVVEGRMKSKKCKLLETSGGKTKYGWLVRFPDKSQEWISRSSLKVMR